MLQYSLEVAICWAILYLIYIVFLRKETFFSINRWYLLSSLALGLLIPILRMLPYSFQEEVIVVQETLYFISAGPELIASNVIPAQEAESILTLSNFLLLIYSIGVLFTASRMILGLVRILNLFKSAKKTKLNQFTLVETNQFHLPFSFLNGVFISKELPLNDDVENILKHELSHVTSWHTLDVLFVELLQVIFWFNPLIYLFKKAIKESHEYVADASVLQDTSQKIYGQILLRQSHSGLQIALANHFFHSHIKNRLTMMKQKKSKWPALMKYLFAMPVILLLMVLFQSQTLPESNQPEVLTAQTFKEQILEEYIESASYERVLEIIAKHVKSENVSGEELDEVLDDLSSEYHINISIEYDENQLTKSCVLNDGPERKIRMAAYSKSKKAAATIYPASESKQMSTVGPCFPGCENMEGSTEEIDECSQKALLRFIYKNINYPAELRNKGVEGLAVAQFVIDKNGTVRDEKMVKDVDGAFEEAILSVINKMRDENIKWKPGEKEGKPIDVVFTFPVKYLLEGSSYQDGRTRLKDMGEFKGDLPMIVVTGLSDAAINQIDTFPAAKKTYTGEIFKVVEQMPRFPGCENVAGTNYDKEECAKKEMLKFIYNNLSYPATAREVGIEGTNVIQFVITANGSITDINLVRDIGGGTGEASETVIRKMAETYTWTPGYQRGKAVNVLYTLPVRFKIESNIENKAVSTTYDLYQNEPNPFNSYTDISFVLPSNGQASISVYNVAGELVKSVQDQFKKGVNTIRITKADLGEVDGPLYYELESSEFKKTRKMIMSQSDSKDFSNSEKKHIEKKISKEVECQDLDEISSEIPILYVIDGKPVEKLDPYIKMLKRDAKDIWIKKCDQLVKKYGKRAEPGVVFISTKVRRKGAEGAFIFGGKALTGNQYYFSAKSYSDDASDQQQGNETNKVKFAGNITESKLGEKKPLVVLDGVKKSKLFFDVEKNLDPDEIESINVIKGEKAIMLYGEEGKNGVVEIITKKKSNHRLGKSNPSKESKIFKVVEEMPRFPGCEHVEGTKAEKEECAKGELLKFIYSNVKYPKEAIESGYEGTAVVQFVIDEKGNVGDENVVRDINGAFAESIYTVIDEMRLQNKVWTPGKQRGKAVKLLFTMPIRFKLEGDHEEDFKQAVKKEEVDDPNNIETSVVAHRPEKTLAVVSLSQNEIQFTYNTDEAGTLNYSVFNMEGKLLRSNTTPVQAGTNVKNINLENAVPGVYVLRLQQGKNDFSRKIIISK